MFLLNSNPFSTFSDRNQLLEFFQNSYKSVIIDRQYFANKIKFFSINTIKNQNKKRCTVMAIQEKKL